MRTSRARIAGVRRGAGWRAFTLLVLIAFALQSFVTQTHIHGAVAAGSTSFGISDASPLKGRAPLPIDAGHCSFCQAIVHAGAFLTPATAVLAVPALSAQCATPIFVAAVFSAATAFDWQSRAPPQA